MEANRPVLSSSGGDPIRVEQARHRELSSVVDHHLGHSGRFTASSSPYLRPLQGQWGCETKDCTTKICY